MGSCGTDASTIDQSHVILSGRLCSGKTTVALALAADGSRVLVSARTVLRALAGARLQTRAELQAYGRDVDRETGGAWLADYVRRLAVPDARVVVDSIRTVRQLRPLRAALRGPVLHVHLMASETALRGRFEARRDDAIIEAGDFEAAEAGECVSEMQDLENIADRVIDTTNAESRDVVAMIFPLIE